MKFTFGVLSYNQEDFIIQHLESIKYQIENYGYEHNFTLVLADDCSTDDTVKIAKKWLDCNKDFFERIIILVSSTNNGIVSNMIRLLRNVNTEWFKISSGDDLYYKNNIFELMRNENMVLSSVACFNNNGIVLFDENYTFKRMILCRNIKELLRRRFKYGNFIEGPGVFYNHNLVDDAVYNYMNRFTWIEDVPLWVSLLNKKETKVSISLNLYMLYRCNVGISNNTGHSMRKGFLDDKDKLQKEIFTLNKMPYKKILTISNSLFKVAYRYIYKKDRRIVCFDSNRRSIEQEGNSFIEYINIQTKKFKECNNMI